jgi:hypothetical protein
MGQRQHGNIDLQRLDLGDRGHGALLMAGNHQQIRLQRLDLGERRRHVVELGRQLIVDHYHHAMTLDVVEDAHPHVLGEGIVLHGERHGDRARLLAELLGILRGEADDAGEILVGGREHGKNVAVAPGEQLPRGAVPLHHGHVIFLDDGEHGLGQAGAVRPEHESDAVLPDQPFGELGAARRGRLVIIIVDGELVVLAANGDAALGIDGIDGKIVAVAGVGTVLRIFAGRRDRSAEDDRVLRHGTGGSDHAQKHRKTKASQPNRIAPHLSLSPPVPAIRNRFCGSISCSERSVQSIGCKSPGARQAREPGL